MIKNILAIFALQLFSTSCYSQEIELGTIFTIQFKDEENTTDFEIIYKKPYNEIINSEINTDSLFDSKPKGNQVHGVFANGKFGTKISPMLILLSGYNDALNYDLKIRLPNKKFFKKTSTVSLFNDVKTIEHWPYQIDKIKFKTFKILPTRIIEEFNFEEKIDSICINNPHLNVEFREEQFKKHIELIVSEFKKSERFKLQKMLDYEKHLNSKDVSLSHFWSLGESIYPNNHKIKFQNPLSFRKIECPYFQSINNYFFDSNNIVRVVYFKWNAFIKSDVGVNPLMTTTAKKDFTEKFNFIVQNISDYLGIPLENITEEDGRRIVLWKSKQGVSAYMFNFSNYNEINLSIYKE